jgi:hypothetical protein
MSLIDHRRVINAHAGRVLKRGSHSFVDSFSEESDRYPARGQAG